MKNVLMLLGLLMASSAVAQVEVLHESADHKEKLVKDKATGKCTGTFESKTGKTSLTLTKDNKLHAVRALLELRLGANVDITGGSDRRDYGLGFQPAETKGVLAYEGDLNAVNFIIFDGTANYIKALKAQLVLADTKTRVISDFTEEYSLKDYSKILKQWRKVCEK